MRLRRSPALRARNSTRELWLGWLGPVQAGRHFTEPRFTAGPRSGTAGAHCSATNSIVIYLRSRWLFSWRRRDGCMLPDLGVASQPGDRQEQAGGSRGAGRASDGRCSQRQSIRRAPGVLLLPNPRFRLQHVAHRGLLQHSFSARRVDIVNGVRAVTGTMTGFIYDHVYTNSKLPTHAHEAELWPSKQTGTMVGAQVRGIASCLGSYGCGRSSRPKDGSRPPSTRRLSSSHSGNLTRPTRRNDAGS